MERYTMLLDWRNQYCENDYTTQSNLPIQCNPHQTTNGIFHRIKRKNSTICMETQKTLMLGKIEGGRRRRRQRMRRLDVITNSMDMS